MNPYRNPKYVERYEDVFFELKTALNTTVANNARQKKDGYRFAVDNSGEVSPFDLYNARISLDFKVNKTSDGSNILGLQPRDKAAMLVVKTKEIFLLNLHQNRVHFPAERNAFVLDHQHGRRDVTCKPAIAGYDRNGIVNSPSSFAKNFDLKINGVKVYDCNDTNHCVNIKNLLEYNPTYAETAATNEFFYLDTNRNAEERPAQAAYNKGFGARKALLGTSRIVSTEIPLNRYSFFENLDNELLPNTRVELNFEIDSDGNLIWQAGDDCRVIITRMQLVVPRITFNSEGQSLYISQYLKPHKWTYVRENIEKSNSTQQRSGNFKITSGIIKPRHVFVFVLNDANIDAQTANPFLYNTFSVSTDPRTLSNCQVDKQQPKDSLPVYVQKEGGLINPYIMPQPFFGPWENQLSMGVKKKTSKKGGGLLLGKNSPFNDIPF